MILKKIRSRSGETLMETLVSVVIIALVIVFLASAGLAATKINAKVREQNNSFSYGEEGAASETLTLSVPGERDRMTGVTRYEDNGYYYYEKAGGSGTP